ncbi:hypothetical protein SeMB42_g01463 [Synchytrium endobioticum]|uniref:Uncharacterized protein n=1 Tax=Synchytrium endobioticum TaxID=286115 RepID=A0A507DL91_9FUNG|nr:hypothetical protein SeMB42_g01463 [Synchytrium endobioticum]
MLGALIQKLAADIDTVFSNQIVGMLPLLKERVVEVVGEAGRLVIGNIEAWVDVPPEDDPPNPPPPVQVFYEINRLLPSPYRRSIVPHTSRDGYVTMSEECLDNSQGLYVRTSSFETNGLVLSMLWIDTTSKPPLRDRAVAYDPNHPNQRRNLAVTAKCLAEPERRYRDWLEANKLEDISAAERECTKSDQETWTEFLECFVRSYDIARAYNSTNKHKRKRWDADKAKRGELDRVLEGVASAGSRNRQKQAPLVTVK